jgi:hypothetical protein
MIFCQRLVFLIELEIIFSLRAWSLPSSHVGAIVETIAGLAAGQSLKIYFLFLSMGQAGRTKSKMMTLPPVYGRGTSS